MRLPTWWPRGLSWWKPLAIGGIALAAMAFTLLSVSNSGPSSPDQTDVGVASQPTLAPADRTAVAGTPPDPSDAEVPSSTNVRILDETVKQWGRLKLDADGFEPGEEVLVTAVAEGDSQPIELGRQSADDTGRVVEFGADLPEAVNSGEWPITVTGLRSNRQGAATLYVRSLEHFALLSSYTPRPTDKLGFVAGGFEPNADVKVYLGDTQSQPIATVRADRAGNTAWTEVTIPTVKPGEYDLTFEGRDGMDRYVQSISVAALTPTLELSPWSGPPGSKFELNGRGFLASETVRVFLGRAQQPDSTFVADEYGNYWGIGPLAVPADAGDGGLSVRLVGEASGAEIEQSFAIVGVTPWAELSAYSGMPGTQISFSGGGFAANEDITVHLGNASGPIVATARTDEGGNVVMSTATAAQPAGETSEATEAAAKDVTFTLVGETSKGEASAVFTVIPMIQPTMPGAGERPGLPQRP